MNIQTIVRRAALALVAGAALCVGPIAQAVPVSLVAADFANGSENFDVTAPTHNGLPTGGFKGTLDTNPIIFWCFELSQTFGFGGPYAYDDSLLASGSQYTLLSELFTGFFSTSVSTTDYSAAFQLAIWEILEDPSPSDLRAGSFHVVSDAGHTPTVDRANYMLANLPTAGYAIHLLHNADSQDFIYGVPPLQQQVPEPAPLLLIGAALAAMLFSLRFMPKRRV